MQIPTSFQKKKILSQIFEDVYTNSKTWQLFSIYENAINTKIDLSANLTQKEFGSGYKNMLNMMESWKNEKYGEKNFTDIWGHIPNNHKNQWFLPSVAEWSAIIDSLNILPGNISQKGFFTEGYWTSSQFNPYCFYYIDLKNNEIGYERLGLMSAVRLATTI